jgi:hypothetical protein
MVTVRMADGLTSTETFVVTTKNLSGTGFQVNVKQTDAATPWTQNLLLDWLAIPQ